MNCGQVMWWVERCAEKLEVTRKVLGIVVDEVSICYADTESRDEFLVAARECGLDNFNNVNDTVFYEYDGKRGGYGVQYNFLKLPTVDWRIELVYTSTSPLHMRQFYNDQAPRIVHVSYKCHGMVDWFSENRVADKQGFAERMYCVSSYGLFSYRRPMRVESWPLERTYLKPRLPWSEAVAPGPLP